MKRVSMSRWSMYGIIVLVALNMRPAITSVGPLTNEIQETFGWSHVVVSSLTVIPVLCMGIFSLRATAWQARFGLERALFYAVGLIGGATVTRAFVSSPSVLFATAIVAGIGIGVASPLIIGWIKQCTSHVASLMSVYSVAMIAGAALAASVSAPLERRLGAWQYALGSWSIFALLALIVLFPLLGPRPTRSTRQQNDRPHAAVPRFVYVQMGMFASMAALFYSWTAWLAPFVVSLGWTSVASGWYVTAFTLIQLPVSWFLPRWVARHDMFYPALLFCIGAEAAGVLVLLSGFPIVAVILLGIGAGGLFPLTLSWPAAYAQTPDEAVRFSAVVQSGGFIVGAFGPAVVGQLVDTTGSFTTSWLLLLVLLMGMGVTTVVLSQEKRQLRNH